MHFCFAVGLIAASVVHLSQSAAFTKRLAANADHPNNCFDPELNLAVTVGSMATDHEDCRSISCSRGPKGDFFVSVVTCNEPVTWPDNCVLTTPSLDLDYPFCCVQLQCDGEPEGSFAAVGK